MILRRGRVLLDTEQGSNLFVRLLLEDVEVEYRATPLRQLGHHLHQYLLGELTGVIHFGSLVNHIWQ